MDNVTHTLTGLALSRAGLHRFSPRSVLLLILSANAPDIDIVALGRGGFRYLEVHRGYTHCLLGLPFMAALAVFVTAAIYRLRLPWFKAWLICCAGVASHLLLDWTNSYGIRLFLPFSSRWLHLDLNSLFDIWILVALVFAAVWPSFSRLVSQEIGSRGPAGRWSAVSALCFIVLFDAARAVMHANAIGQLQTRVYDGMAPVRVAALPGPYVPQRWQGVVETAADYRVIDIDAFSELHPGAAKIFYKPPLTPALRRISSIDPFRFFLYFARFPVWSQQPVSAGPLPATRYDLTDLRFGAPGAGSFHCIALATDAGRILQTWFSYGSGTDLGWGDTTPRASR